jgi:hypothetical protein
VFTVVLVTRAVKRKNNSFIFLNFCHVLQQIRQTPSTTALAPLPELTPVAGSVERVDGHISFVD